MVARHQWRHRQLRRTQLNAAAAVEVGGPTTVAEVPEDKEADELLSWLSSAGCEGMEALQLPRGGGLELRPTAEPVLAGDMVYMISFDACLAVQGPAASCHEELAWELLSAVWAGSDGPLSSFIRFLERDRLARHPLLWEDDEVSGLAPSYQAYETILAERQNNRVRLEGLCVRARASPEVVPESLLADEDALKAQILWALAMVEARGIQIQPEADSDKAMAFLVPLIHEERYTHKEEERNLRLVFGAKGLELFAGTDIAPGTSLFGASLPAATLNNSLLLASKGIVPGSEKASTHIDVELADMNRNADVMVDIYPPTGLDEEDPLQALKHELLIEYAQLRFPPPPDEGMTPWSCSLPRDLGPKGRLLRAARFLIWATGAEDKRPSDEMVKAAFCRFFRDCDLPNGMPDAGGLEKAEQTWSIEAEIVTVDFMVRLLTQRVADYDEYIQTITAGAGLKRLKRDDDGPSATLAPNCTVLAHFKSKGKDGTIVKSKKPRPAAVIEVLPDQDTVRLEFLENQKRHEVPVSWISHVDQPEDGSPAGGPASSSSTSERQLRAELTTTLLRADRAVLDIDLRYLRYHLGRLNWLRDQAISCNQRGDEKGQEKLVVILQDLMRRLQNGDVAALLHGVPPSQVPQIPEDPAQEIDYPSPSQMT